MSKTNTVRQWDKNNNTYIFSPKTKKTIKRVAGRRGRPSYAEADVKSIPESAEELSVDDISMQARKALGLSTDE